MASTSNNTDPNTDQTMTAFINESATKDVILVFNIIKEVYKQTPEDSPIRKYALQTFHYTMNGLNLDDPVIKGWDMVEVQQGLMEDGELLLDYLKSVKNRVSTQSKILEKHLGVYSTTMEKMRPIISASHLAWAAKGKLDLLEEVAGSWVGGC